MLYCQCTGKQERENSGEGFPQLEDLLRCVRNIQAEVSLFFPRLEFFLNELCKFLRSKLIQIKLSCIFLLVL